jgi:hypothetical protein
MLPDFLAQSMASPAVRRFADWLAPERDLEAMAAQAAAVTRRHSAR